MRLAEPPGTASPVTSPSPLWFAAIFAVALIPLLSTPVLPFIDLYNHLARYFVLGHVAASPVLQQSYQANWSLLPNIGLDIIGTALLRVVPPRLAAHAVVILIFVVQYGGLLAFNRALTGRWSRLVAVLAVPLLYSFILNWGFANFLLGLGLVFAAAAWWLRLRTRTAVGVPVAAIAAVVIFFTHGVDFALYGILLVMLEVGLWRQHPGRSLGELAAALVPVAVQAIVPVILFVATATSHARGGVTTAGASIQRLKATGALGDRVWELVCYRLTTIVRVEEGPALWFDLLTFVAQVALVGCLVGRGRVAVSRTAVPAIVVGAVLVALVPPALFGVGYVADRMPLFLAMIVIAALACDPPFRGRDRVAVGLLAAITVLRLVAIAGDWQTYRRSADELRQVATSVPPGALLMDAYVGGSRHDDRQRCQMYSPLLVGTRGIVTPLFANETQQPLRLVGRLQRAFDGLERAVNPVSSQSDTYREVIRLAGPAGFDYVLLCHEAPPVPTPPGRIVAATTHFTLFKVGSVPDSRGRLG